MMSMPTIETEEMKFSVCSNCFNPKSGCCQKMGCRNYFGQDETRSVQVPKVSGRYFTEFFDTEEQEERGQLIRSSKIKEYFYAFIIKNEEYKIKQLFESLEKVYSYFREETYHNAECEFAVGKSCNCWCNEKYHGLRGQGAMRKQQK